MKRVRAIKEWIAEEESTKYAVIKRKRRELDNLYNGTECAFHMKTTMVHFRDRNQSLHYFCSPTLYIVIALFGQGHQLVSWMTGKKPRRSTTLCLTKAQYTKVSPK